MEINALTLPDGFVRDIRDGKFRKEIGDWDLKEDFDAFGNSLETEIGDVCESSESLLSETEVLWKYFVDEDPDGVPNEWENEPGYIPYIKDYSKIVWFASGGDGSPFCFDFRDALKNPSVIWW